MFIFHFVFDGDGGGIVIEERERGVNGIIDILGDNSAKKSALDQKGYSERSHLGDCGGELVVVGEPGTPPNPTELLILLNNTLQKLAIMEIRIPE